MKHNLETTMYKVVSCIWPSDILYSALYEYYSSEMQLQYEKDKWTHAPVFGCMIFSNIQDAIKFLNCQAPEGHNMQLWSCDASEVRQVQTVCYPSRVTKEHVRECLNLCLIGNVERYYELGLQGAPYGSYTAQAVRLKERIDPKTEKVWSEGIEYEEAR